KLTRFGVLFVLLGILLLSVTSNIFYNSICSYTYLTLWLPLLGVYCISKERRNYNIEHSRYAALSLTLMIVFFLIYLTMGLLHVHFLWNKGNFQAVKLVFYSVEASYFLLLVASIISLMGLGSDRKQRLAIIAMTITVVLVLFSLFLIESPTEEYVGALKDIGEDNQLKDFQKTAMYEKEVGKYNKNLFIPRLPQVAAGILTMISVVLLGKEPIRGFKTVLKMRFRGALR
ncbi:MAG: hypothetical protein QGH39_10610, partial [Candidatus Thermoplasmatota archaeon]|nr:hypothetical protein [Candidatus Thermoplasmatota archaeon]